jgi:hypothetical protein
MIRRVTLRLTAAGRELAIVQDSDRPGHCQPRRALVSAYLCDLSAAQARDVLGPLLGGRLRIHVPA